MHLPPEVERLAPELLSRVAPPGEIDAAEEAERIETLLLDGDPRRWLDHLRERAGVLEASAERGQASGPDLVSLAGMLRDQLALIQATLDLDAEDLALLERLERLERRRPGT